jgi:hypothetical protein
MLARSIDHLEGSVHGARPRGTLVVAFAALLLAVPCIPAFAQARTPRHELLPQRIVSLDSVLLETVRIEGQVQGWTMRKLCIDGQAYWVGFSETNPTGISPAFKDGKAEQCSPRAK